MAAQLFAGIPVRDLEVAIDWYTRLLGLEVSFRPDETEAVWQLDEGVFVYVKTGRDVVGGALNAVTAEDLDGLLAGAAERGITPIDVEQYEDARKAVFVDPDGNEFGVISLPSDVE